MFRSPSGAGLPGIDAMLQDIPATMAQVARHLGIKESTLKTYRRTGNAPRAVMLALFWETRWGRSAADTEAANWGAMYYREAMLTKRELERITGIIWRLEQELSQVTDWGWRAANVPVFKVA